MADLISLDRAKAQLTGNTCDDAAISAAISAASTFIENYCGRRFAYGTFDQLYTVAGWTSYLLLDNSPIDRVVAVRTGRTAALFVQHNDGQNAYQYANVEITPTGLTLTKFGNAVLTTNTLTFADYPTVGSLKTAINAVTGWQSTGSAQFDTFSSSDILEQGTFGARNSSVSLSVYWKYLSNFRVNYDLGEIWLPGGACSGYQEYRVTYQGGYKDVPEDLQQAVAELTQQIIASRTANPLMQSETLDKYSYTRAATNGFDQLSTVSRKAIQSYKIYKAAKYK